MRILILALLVGCSTQNIRQELFKKGCMYGVKTAQARGNVYFPLSHEFDTDNLYANCVVRSKEIE